MQKQLIFLTLFAMFVLFSAWVYTNGTKGPPAANSAGEAVIRGKLLYQDRNCTACHQIYGLGGYLGPELTHTVSTPGKGELYATALLKTGTAVMPDFHLSDAEISDLVAYLSYIDRTHHEAMIAGLYH